MKPPTELATHRAKNRPKALREQAAARAWLSEQGIEVPSRGRISAALMERYENR